MSTITTDYEIILIDDGSTDNTWQKLCVLASADSRIKGIRLAQNCGQHQAIAAGLAATKGEWMVVMDGDLQDEPEYIPTLYQQAISEKSDLIISFSKATPTTFFRKMTTAFYHRLFGLHSGIEHGYLRNYSLLHRKVVKAYLAIPLAHKPYLSALQSLSFTPTYLQIEPVKRQYGKSGYTLKKLAQLTWQTLVFRVSLGRCK